VADERTTAAVSLRQASLRRGERTLWAGLDIEIAPGEFVAVLGPNGSGKTSLLKVLLGQLPLTGGTVTVAGETPRRGSDVVGYVPQQKGFDIDLGVRGRDLVGFGVDGHRFGVWPVRGHRERVDAAIEAVGATWYAKHAIGRLSGGEQQRLRIAQALVGDPAVLLCDEPLLSLDLNHQRGVVELLDRLRREREAAIVMVSHEINPVLPVVDRVVYIVDGRCAVGTPDEVMTSRRLSELYGTAIDVVRVRDRIVVLGAETEPHHEHEHFHEEPHPHGGGHA
jgi:zinc/manganese transport system ATP-binding protein